MKPRITNVYVFENGMCMVFDQNGKQMPEYQGEWVKVKDDILKVFDKERVQYGKWIR
jgi:hypothetical protein